MFGMFHPPTQRVFIFFLGIFKKYSKTVPLSASVNLNFFIFAYIIAFAPPLSAVPAL